MRQLNFNDGGNWPRMSKNTARKSIQDYDTSDYSKGKKEFKITQKELENAPGYKKPEGPKD